MGNRNSSEKQFRNCWNGFSVPVTAWNLVGTVLHFPPNVDNGTEKPFQVHVGTGPVKKVQVPTDAGTEKQFEFQY